MPKKIGNKVRIRIWDNCSLLAEYQVDTPLPKPRAHLPAAMKFASVAFIAFALCLQGSLAAWEQAGSSQLDAAISRGEKTPSAPASAVEAPAEPAAKPLLAENDFRNVEDMTREELEAHADTLDIFKPESRARYMKVLAKISEFAMEDPEPTPEEAIQMRVNASIGEPQYEHCRKVFRMQISDTDSVEKLLGNGKDYTDETFGTGVTKLVDGCKADVNSTGYRIDCTHMERVLAVMYFTLPTIYRKNLDYMCVAVDEHMIATEDEPSCMRWMEEISMDFYHVTGKYVTWPTITKRDEFGAVFNDVCMKIEENTQSECDKRRDAVKAVEDPKSNNGSDMQVYTNNACNAMGVSLADHDAPSLPSTLSQRGRIHTFFLKAGGVHDKIKAKAEARARSLAQSDESIQKRIYKTEWGVDALDVNPDEEFGKDSLLSNRGAASDGEASFSRAMVGKRHSHNPHRHTIYGSPRICGQRRYLCDKKGYTAEIGASVSAGLCVGGSVLSGGGYGLESTYRGSWKANNQHGIKMGQETTYASACFGVQTNIAIGMSKIDGYYNNKPSINGFSKVLGASGGPWIFSVGGGVVRCTGDYWRPPSHVCGGYTEFGIGLSLLPAEVTSLNCKAFKNDNECTIYYGGSCPSCFPGDSTVQTPAGVKMMSNLRVGDKVLTTGARGDLTYEPVTFFGHADASASTVMTSVTLQGAARALRLSKRHFVPACPVNGIACEYSERTHKYSEDLQVGDHMWTHAADGELVLSRVEGLKDVVETGVFNPYTVNGNIVVDGVLASAHSDWVFDAYTPKSLQQYLPAFYNMLFLPLRIAYYLTGAATAEALDLAAPMTLPHGYGAEFGMVLTIIAGAAAAYGARKMRRRQLA